MALPRFILLKSSDNKKYLRYTKEDRVARLRFSQDGCDKNAEIRYLRFEVEKAKMVDGFVHIRTCYNNKYLVRKSAKDNAIVAEANEPEEDQAKWSCTLFKSLLLDADRDALLAHTEPQKIRLVHISQLGQHNACMSKTSGDPVEDFKSDTCSDDNGDVLTASNADSMVTLPEYVAFIGHSGQYAAITTTDGLPHMEFKTNDIGAAGVTHKITQSSFEPYVYIQNTSNQKFWALSSNYIFANSSEACCDCYPETAFTPIVLDGNVIALRCCADNKRFANCGRGHGMEHVLGASNYSITLYAKLRLAEPVLRRKISDVTYNLDDSRIYDKSKVQKFCDSRENYTSLEQTGEFKVSYTTSQTMSWNDSVSVTCGINGSWSCGIPYVGDVGVEVSAERTESREWGTEKREEKTVENVQTLTIPSQKKVTLKVIANRASCDVPFTCMVHDTMTDGTTRSYKKNGLFVGCNEYNIVMQIKEGDL